MVTTVEARARSAAKSARALIEHGDPATASSQAQQLAELCDELRAMLGPSLAHEPARAADVCELLTALTGLQQDLREHMIDLRFRAVARIHAGLARLRERPTIAELLADAPSELCTCCDFDRAAISRVRGSTWAPEVLHIAGDQDPEVGEALQRYMQNAEIPLSPMMLETELARRGAPALVTDPGQDPSTFSELMAISRTRAYVAAPIMPSGRVIGFLHADCFGSARTLTVVDRDNLWTFAEGFGTIFERTALLERLSEQRARVREAFRSIEHQIDDLCDAEVRLARQQHALPTDAATAAAVFAAPPSRLAALLTPREREVLELMAGGARNSQIAGQLVISEGTVKSHVKNICRKLRVGNRAEAVSKYLQSTLRGRT